MLVGLVSTATAPHGSKPAEEMLGGGWGGRAARVRDYLTYRSLCYTWP